MDFVDRTQFGCIGQPSIQTPEADKIAETAGRKAWVAFLAKYPNAGNRKFVS